MKMLREALLVLFCALVGSNATWAAPPPELSRADAAARVEPPYQLGEEIGNGTWKLVNLDGRVAGYAFETAPLSPLPGFSGAPINLFVSVSLEGRLIGAEIISHNEPIFVSGLGEAPFHAFVDQYRGHFITDSLVVGVPYGDQEGGSSLVYLDGVTKATASVRIAHESLLAAAFKIARKHLQGFAGGGAAYPDLNYAEDLTWGDLVEQGIATRRLVSNAEVDQAFKGSLWEDDDPEAREAPADPYLDLWIVDLGPPAVAQAVLSPETAAALAEFRTISEHDEPILVIDAGRHGLVGEDFVRNTSPDLLSAAQDGLPVALRDADLDISLAPDVPQGTAMILRTDRRLGFDPVRSWTLSVRAVREHGFFRPEIGTVDFSAEHVAKERFFIIEKTPEPVPPWRQAIEQRLTDIVVLAVFLIGLTIVLLIRQDWLASRPWYGAFRTLTLVFVIGFVGWWGQGQLSIATVLGVARSVYEGQSLLFLLYDPFSLMIWVFVLVSFVLWGRGYYCGWLCPFGAMQELTHKVGRWLRLPVITVPDRWDRRLIALKYAVLSILATLIFLDPASLDAAIEVEPFKTAVTTYFVREWYFVAYAVLLLAGSAVLFKGFCRYLCPLGAFLAIGGLLRGRNWIARRQVCGSPCQLCRVKCNYNAINPSGEIRYSECFQCLDCVTIHEDEAQCVPLVLAAKGRTL